MLNASRKVQRLIRGERPRMQDAVVSTDLYGTNKKIEIIKENVTEAKMLRGTQTIIK